MMHGTTARFRMAYGSTFVPPTVSTLIILVIASTVFVHEARAQQAIAASAAFQIQTLESIKRAKTETDRKIDSGLYLALLNERSDTRLTALPDFRFARAEDDGRVPVDIMLGSAAGVQQVVDTLASLGDVMRARSFTYRRVSARIRLENLEALAALADVRTIRRAVPFLTNKVNTSEGDVTHAVDQARSFFGVTGAGVKVCAISDGVDSLAALQASDDLPAVDVLPGQAGSGDEGSAMLEIIHDLAPDATLGFATANPNEATFAQNILDLAADGCNIIVDDIIYLDESPFQDGPVAQSVNTVTAAGVLYFSSAGNEGNVNDLTSGTWEGDFNPNGTPAVLAGAGPVHNFGDGGQSILVEFGGGNPPVLTWAEHYDLSGGTASTDFDIYVLNGTLTTIFDASTDVQDGVGGDDQAFEIVTGGTFSGERLVVAQFAAGSTSSVPMFNLILFRGELDDALVTSGATRGHSAAPSAFSVAATPTGASFDGITPDGPFPGVFTSANASESFTSDGPRRIILSPTGTEITPANRTTTGGIVRQKPDITAADGVATAAPGFNPFYGTSAAAPHAAAIAALMKSAVPSLTPAQVRTALIASAIDIETAGVDRDTGAGIIMADVALQLAGAVPTAPAVSGTKTVSGTFQPGGAVTYTVVLTNTGSATQPDNPGNELTDVLPASLDLVSATATSGTAIATLATNTVTWNGSIPMSGTVTLTITAIVDPATNAGSVVANQGTIAFDADNNGTNESSAVTDDPGSAAVDDPTTFTVTSPATLSATKTVSGTFTPGGSVTYTVVVSNSGPAAQLDNPGNELTDVVPASLNLVSAAATSGTAVANVGTNTVTWNGSVGAGGSVTLTIHAMVKPATSAGTVVANQASISFDADGNGTNESSAVTNDPSTAAPSDPTSFTATSPATITGTKTVTGTFTPGGAVTYSVVLSNSGPATQLDNPGSELTDVLPANVTLVSAAATSGSAVATLATNTVTWNGTIAASSSVTITISATVVTAIVSGTSVVNQGTISFDADGNGTNEAAGVTDDSSVAGANNPTPFSSVCQAITVTPTSVPTLATGTAVNQNFTASGGIGSVTFAVTGTLPNGVSLSTAGLLSGTPSQAGNFPITVTATDANGCTGSVALTLTVESAEPTPLVYGLAEGATGAFFDTYLLLANPNTTAAPISVTYAKDDGSTVVDERVLAPESRITIAADTLPGLSASSFAPTVSSTDGLPVLVERSMFWDASYYAGSDAAAVSAGTQWYFAEGSAQTAALGGGGMRTLETYLLLGNAGDGAANVSARFFTESGSVVTRNYSVPGHTRVTLYLGAIPELSGHAFGVELTSTVPITAERSVYVSPGLGAGHASAGAAQPSTLWYHAEGATGSFFETYLLLLNPSAGSAQATVNYYLPSGEVVTLVHTVPAHSRVTINVEDEDSRLASATFWTSVQSTVPIVSERSMYWPVAGNAFGEGHNSTGISQPGTRWGLAEGFVGGPLDFETYYLLVNPTNTAATVTVTFLRTTGSTLSKSYVVAARSRFTVWVNNLVPELNDESFGAVVTSTNGVPIIVERSIYWTVQGQAIGGGTNATAIPLP